MPRSGMCEMCGENPFKYRCPACNQQTCSLVCINKHKESISCSGVRNKTQYVAVKGFDVMQLLSDYRMLEDVGRFSDSANRDRLKNPHTRPKHLKRMVAEARKRHTTLRLMPYPMSKRASNKSYFQYQKQKLFWHVEWVFPAAKSKHVQILPETSGLAEALSSILHSDTSSPIIRHQLRSYVKAPVDELTFLMKLEGEAANIPRYCQLNGTKTLAENFAGKTLVEYPTILVVFEQEASVYTIVCDKDEEVKSADDESTMLREEKSTSVDADTPSISQTSLQDTSGPASYDVTSPATSNNTPDNLKVSQNTITGQS